MLTQEEARKILIDLKDNYGVSYTDIANETGISKSHISAFIKEKTNMKKQKLDLIINYIEKEIIRHG